MHVILVQLLIREDSELVIGWPVISLDLVINKGLANGPVWTNRTLVGIIMDSRRSFFLTASFKDLVRLKTYQQGLFLFFVFLPLHEKNFSKINPTQMKMEVRDRNLMKFFDFLDPGMSELYTIPHFFIFVIQF